MPLVELVQNLQNFPYHHGGPGNFTQKSLGFGKDRPWGSSPEPYLKWPLPENAPRNINDYYILTRNSLDFPIRGGSLQYLREGLFIPQAASYDRQRIQRFLQNSPKGSTFITKQVGLQLSNPKLETGTQLNLQSNTPFGASPGVVESTRVYNRGLNTLTQVGVQGSGIHADRHGLLPYNPPRLKYVNFVTKANTDKDNRLVILTKTKLYEGLKDPELRSITSRLGISRDQSTLFNYLGGPGSVYGIGFTTIGRYVDTSGRLSDKEARDLYGSDGKNISPAKLLQEGDKNKTREKGYIKKSDGLATKRIEKLSGSLAIGDGYAKLFTLGNPTSSSLTPFSSSESQVNKFSSQPEQTYRTGFYSRSPRNNQSDTNNQNVRAFTYSDLLKVSSSLSSRLSGSIGEDFRITTDGISGPKGYYPSESGELKKVLNRRGDYSNFKDEYNKVDLDKTKTSPGGEDLIDFYFEAQEYSQSVSILFRAFITDIQDSHSGEFQPYRYMGRGENFYTYNGFTRQISFNMKVVAFSEGEMKPIYKKANYLTSQLYPDYSEGGFMRSPLLKLTIGKYLVNQPGFLTGVNITIDSNTPWDIDKGLPMGLSLACQFTPIHDFLPRRSQDRNPTSLFAKNLF
jgi:hypothetical protein